MKISRLNALFAAPLVYIKGTSTNADRYPFKAYLNLLEPNNTCHWNCPKFSRIFLISKIWHTAPQI